MSAIEWTDETWNPTTGCDRISAGCDHCYAMTMAKRLKGMGQTKYQRDGNPRTSGPGFGVSVHPDELRSPLRWRKPRLVFVNSMSDLFHGDIPDEFIARVWAVMAATPQHTYQVLTKRHGRMRALLSSERFPEMVGDAHTQIMFTRAAVGEVWRWSYPLPNMWLGVSVEDQLRAELRVPFLEDTPAAVRFLSCEPLLSGLDLGRWLTPWPGWCQQCGAQMVPGSGTWCRSCETTDADYSPNPRRRLDWVIAGGESGHAARPMHPDWARSLRDQCQAAGVPFFFKQWGEWEPRRVHDAPEFVGGRAYYNLGESGGRTSAPRSIFGHRARMLDDETVAVRVGKAKAGRELDGRTWDEFPRVAGRV